MRRVAAALAVLVLAACGGGGGGTGNGPTTPSGPQITISGNAAYEDRLYDGDGFTGAIQRRPVRFATVQLVADDTGAVLGETTTRADGGYTLTAPITEGRTIHVALVARVAQPLPAEVLTIPLQAYSLGAPPFAAAARAFSQVFLARTDDLGGVFNILDAAVEGAERVRVLQPAAAFGRVRLLWSTVNRQRASFNENNNTIQLRGHPDDPDEYDDPVILHEFGHYVANFFSVDTSPGGPHSPFDDEPEPPSLAWSEGFATWFGTDVRQSPIYMDSFGTGTFTMEIETPTFGNLLVGPDNELAVAAALWDVSDPANEPHDALDRRVSQLWDVVNGHFRQVRPVEVTVQTFCSGWLARGHGQAAELRAVFADRGIACP
jgi:hypothetical protein